MDYYVYDVDLEIRTIYKSTGRPMGPFSDGSDRVRNGKVQGSISLVWYTEILCTVVVTFTEVGISGHYSSNITGILIPYFNALSASFS